MSMNRNLLHFLKMHYQTRQDSELPLFGLILNDNERNHLNIDLCDIFRVTYCHRILIIACYFILPIFVFQIFQYLM